ncbi:filamentous hemagglutinin N-terminal domain-containing protein [Spirulina subsalsa CS-330]|uniref:two-partner secretion domain-containing protein n=1 Tax=Spirulina TaxID=1154 RepID=UPI00232E9C3D|nr:MULTISPECIES: filamentous hemagglutinin N-terminal domain-containing protein [Spirulina]MDB9493802.1 filamentous hemagglutinin N-terminal domain-containing protein [Spirulina subsalsa CS-330]
MSPHPAHAQLLPDATLGAESSQVIHQPHRAIIQGGASRGSSLFHSFQDFNVNAGQAVYFANPAQIGAIFTRVTGGNPSDILGTLGVDGGADLFLLNPNGIYFGPNARLDVAGSFYASTADQFLFDDGQFFSATNPNAPPLLSLNITPGLQYPTHLAGNLTSDAHLGAAPGQTLTLIGNQLVLAGSLTAPGGTVELLGNELRLTDRARVDVSGAVGGEIFVGGDYRGLGDRTPAHTTTIDPGALLQADGTTQGGRVILWADETMRFGGTVTARDRGFVEVSGKQNLIFRGDVNTNGGTLLLDPQNITIANGAGTDTATTIYEENLEALAGNNAVILVADDHITLEDLADDELTFQEGGGPITFQADADWDGVGTFKMDDLNDTIATNGRDLNIVGAELAIGAINTTYTETYIVREIREGYYQPNYVYVSFLNAWVRGIGATWIPPEEIDVEKTRIISAGSVELRSFEAATSVEMIRGGDVTIWSAGDAIVNQQIQTIFGNIDITATGDIDINGDLRPGSLGDTNGYRGISLTASQGISIDNANLSVQNDAITIQADQNIEFFATTINHHNTTESSGNNIQIRGASIDLDTSQITTTGDRGGSLSSGFSQGLGANIQLIATDTINLASTNLTTNTGYEGGQSGSIDINTQQLNVGDSTQINTQTKNANPSGAIAIDATGDLNLDGIDSQIFSSTKGGGNAGDITIRNAANLTVENGFTVTSTTSKTDPTVTGQTGSITLDNIDAIRVAAGAQISTAARGQGDAQAVIIRDAGSVVMDGEGSALLSETLEDATGDTAGIQIDAQTLEVRNGGTISASSRGAGNAGLVAIAATDTVTIQGQGSTGEPSAIKTTVDSDSTGSAAGISIDTGTLTVGDGARLLASTVGEGDGGNVTVTAREAIALDQNGTIRSEVEAGAVGNSGAVTLTTQRLDITNGSGVSTDSAGQGNAGKITITAADGVSLSGWSGITNNVQASGVGDSLGIDITTQQLDMNQSVMTTGSFGQGNAGAIAIQAADTTRLSSITLDNQGMIGTDVFAGARGNAGTVNLTADRVQLTGGSLVSTTTRGDGNSGRLTVTADDAVVIDGAGSGRVTGLVSLVMPGATGNSAGIEVRTQDLNVRNGGVISASTNSTGTAGLVNVVAGGTVRIDGENDLGSTSAIASNVINGATGHSEGIQLTAANLTLTNGGIITGTTDGEGNSGAVTATITGTTQIHGTSRDGAQNSQLVSRVEPNAQGNSAGINLRTGTLDLAAGGFISATTAGRGDSGQVSITATGDAGITGDGSGVFSRVQQGAVGNSAGLEIRAANLTVSDRAEIIASTNGQGNAGAVTAQADQITIDAATLASAVGTNGVGSAGAVRLTAANIDLRNGAVVSSATAGTGNAGQVRLQGDQITMNRSTLSTAVELGAIGNAGNISLQGSQLAFNNDSLVTSSTDGRGNAGQIQATASESVILNSSTFSTAVAAGAVGNAGGVTVQTPFFELRDRARISSNSSGQGVAGDIRATSQSLALRNQSAIQAETNQGDGGNIFLTAQDFLILRHGSSISTTAGTASAGGNGGNITLNAGFIFGVRGENSDITANAFTGNGGRIDITTQQIYGLRFRDALTPWSDITASSQFGQAGVVGITLTAFDASQGVNELPSDFSDRTNQIGDACSSMGNSRFTVVGRGGVGELLQPLLGSGAGEWHDSRSLTTTGSTPFSLESFTPQILSQSQSMPWLTTFLFPTVRGCQ